MSYPLDIRKQGRKPTGFMYADKYPHIGYARAGNKDWIFVYDTRTILTLLNPLLTAWHSDGRYRIYTSDKQWYQGYVATISEVMAFADDIVRNARKFKYDKRSLHYISDNRLDSTDSGAIDREESA